MKSFLLEAKPETTLAVVEDTQYVIVADGSLDENTYLELDFNKQGVTAEILGFFKLTGTESVNLTTVTKHMAPNTSCRTEVKGVLDGSASLNYTGKIIIEKGAQQTSSFLHDSVLVVGDHTKNTSKPILEIEADDVRASHGATTGRIDKSQVYYLMSRGLSEEEAQHLIVEGYFESLLGTIVDESVREQVVNILKLN